jgi:hypothetical protein
VLANLGAGATIQAFNVEAVYAWFIIASLATMACGFWLHPEPIAQPAATPLGTRLLDLQDQRKNVGSRWALTKAGEPQCKPSKKT